jgi:DNA-binding MarR family transcriptional regulator
LTPVLKSLESKGYVHRSRSRADERVLEVEITEKGEGLKNQAVAVPQNVASCVKLSADEAVQLYQLLYKMLAGLKEEQ